MKTLQEIQEEVAIEKGYKSWMEVWPSNEYDLWPIICERAQFEACKATLEKAADKFSHPVHRGEVLHQSNIVIIK
jgi:hypothetical protein